MTDLAVSTCVLDIVIPVYNEERELAGSIRRLHHDLATEVPYRSRITVADNASTDHTLTVARQLADELSNVDVIHLDAKGRGGALYAAWMASQADVVAYMDVDLSTDLSALMPLVAGPIRRAAAGFQRAPPLDARAPAPKLRGDRAFRACYDLSAVSAIDKGLSIILCSSSTDQGGES